MRWWPWQRDDAPVTPPAQAVTVMVTLETIDRVRSRHAGDAEVTAVCDALECALVTLQERYAPVVLSMPASPVVTPNHDGVTQVKRPMTGAERMRRYRQRKGGK